MANPDVQRAFLANPEQKLPPHAQKQKSEPRRRSPKRGKGLAPVSAKKEVTDKIHDAYRDAFIFLARRYDDLRCWVCGIECKPSQLDLHHDTRRGQGGKHRAHNYLLACNKKSQNGVNNCHDRLDGNDLRWSKESA